MNESKERTRLIPRPSEKTSAGAKTVFANFVGGNILASVNGKYVCGIITEMTYAAGILTVHVSDMATRDDENVGLLDVYADWVRVPFVSPLVFDISKKRIYINPDTLAINFSSREGFELDLYSNTHKCLTKAEHFIDR